MNIPAVKSTPAAEALAARQSALLLPAHDNWTGPARKDALARLEAMGLPGRRDEYWRFTRPDSFNQPVAQPASVFDYGDEAPVFSQLERLKLVFTDGVFDPGPSDDLSLSGVEISQLSKAGNSHWATDLYGTLEARGQNPVKRPFATLNTAYAPDGILIHVTGKVTKPICISYRHSDPSSDVILHHVIKLEEGAELTLVENGAGAARLNTVMEVEVADTASFHHVRAQGRDHERRAVTHMFARLGRKSLFKSFTLTANGALTRNECVIEVLGDDATAHVAGAALGDGAAGDFHHDDTVFITHDAVNCESRQVFKKVLRNGATGVFQGKILVQPGAQKTDGYQKSQALLLDDDSVFLAKPELEIYADDVACSHGSTSGEIDGTALFYLRSRGVPEAKAQDLMVLAFLAETLDEIDDAVIAADILSRLEAWLERRRD